MKLIGLLVASALILVLRYIWKAKAKRRLAAIDRGEICIGCNSTMLTVDGNIVTCDACGDVRDLESLRESQLSEAELERLFTPEKRGFWD